MSKLSFISLIAYDYEYLIRSISSYYDIADEIILGLDEDLVSWSNLPINIDKNKVKNDILAIDCDNKIKIIESNFHSQGKPMKNDIYERNFLSKLCKDNNWIIQIDADEAISNGEEFQNVIEDSDPNFQLTCNWILLFKKISTEKYIKLNDNESCSIATKLKGQFVRGRETNQSIKQLPIKIIHCSWCRTEDELYTKLKNWRHSQDFDVDKFFQIWKSINEYNYMHFYNIHPLYPNFWPSLSLININEIDSNFWKSLNLININDRSNLYRMRLHQHLIDGLIDLIQYTQLPLKQFDLLEIGSFAGESTAIFAKYANKIYAVDPWINYPDGDKNSAFPVDAEQFFDNVVKLNPNIIKIKLTSEEAVKQFEDESLDIIYIDGDHFKAGFDIDLWMSKVKKDGWIAGHDYHIPQVKNDVDNRFGDRIKIFSDDSWAIKKSEIM
jgi:SAM-dependent methyltransferase